MSVVIIVLSLFKGYYVTAIYNLWYNELSFDHRGINNDALGSKLIEPIIKVPQQIPGSCYSKILIFAGCISPMSVLTQPPLDDLALEEVLDALDPLRHYFHPSNAEDIIPLQPSSAIQQIRELSFGHNTCPVVSISLAVDASPGCGGIAWPAGQVNTHNFRRS